MSLSDPIADMLTRIRNAQMAQHDVVDVPHSKLKGEIARVLKREGFIKDFSVEGGKPKTLRIFLKYTGDHEPLIQGLKRVSKPGQRHFVKADEIPRVVGGLGINVISTSAGVMTGKEAGKRRLGGEVVCAIW